MNATAAQLSGMSDVMKKRWAVTWCMEFLYRDIDALNPEDVVTLLDECEAMMNLAAPLPGTEDERWYYTLSSHPDAVRKRYETAQTEQYKTEFKGYQQAASRIIKRLRSISPEKLEKKTAEMAVLLYYRIDRDGRFHMNIRSRDRFEYSFLYHLISVLRDRRFADVVHTCVHCRHYFLKLSGHRKECCSHRCSHIVARRKRQKRDKSGENKKNALYQLHHRAKSLGCPEAERARLLTRHIQKKEYPPEAIPKSYRGLMEKYAQG